VLVVDDIAVVRGLISRQLREGGYDVLEAATGGEALLLLATPGVRANLVITDLRMPDVQGQELGAAMADVPGTPRVLYMSAYPPPEGLDSHFLLKPFTHQQLLTAVGNVLAP
jgi:CheY-like chemotaxis protein